MFECITSRSFSKTSNFPAGQTRLWVMSCSAAHKQLTEQIGEVLANSPKSLCPLPEDFLIMQYMPAWNLLRLVLI
jgi:hypothetical protein